MSLIEKDYNLNKIKKILADSFRILNIDLKQYFVNTEMCE